jgi:hypothetical protein
MHHLAQARLRTILLNILYVETFSASPFDVRFKGNEPHADHILLKEYSDNPATLKFDIETYRDFRNRRRDEILSILKKVVDLTDEQQAQANATAADA